MLKYTYVKGFGVANHFIEENDARIFDTEAELIEAVDSMPEDEWVEAGALELRVTRKMYGYVVDGFKELEFGPPR